MGFCFKRPSRSNSVGYKKLSCSLSLWRGLGGGHIKKERTHFFEAHSPAFLPIFIFINLSPQNPIFAN